MLVALACIASFAAGLVDAVAGGGGLIQLPALMVLFPDSPVPTLLGTNKAASIAGTAVALRNYARAVPLPWHLAGPAAAAAFVGSFTGARLASRLPSEWMRPIVFVLLVIVAVYTFVRKDLGSARVARGGVLVAVVMGAGLGLYDGFFGPGTGSFLLFGFVALLGLDFLGASASAKLVNVATNFAALLAFAAGGHIRLDLAIPMACFNVAGSQVGSRLALARGAPFVRKLFLVVVTVLLVRIGWEIR